MPIKINGATSGSTTITAPATGSDETIELSTALASKLDASEYVAWTSYTPTLTNVTVGNGTLTGSYAKIGKIVVGQVKFTLGSTSAVTGQIIVSMPTTVSGIIMANAIFGEAGVQTRLAGTYGESAILGSNVYLYAVNASATYAGYTTPSSTIPFTWGTNDAIVLAFQYREA